MRDSDIAAFILHVLQACHGDDLERYAQAIHRGQGAQRLATGETIAEAYLTSLAQRHLYAQAMAWVTERAQG